MNGSRSHSTTFFILPLRVRAFARSFEGSRMVRIVAKMLMKPIRQSLSWKIERHVLGDRFACDDT
jgi:hypothetical protein